MDIHQINAADICEAKERPELLGALLQENRNLIRNAIRAHFPCRLKSSEDSSDLLQLTFVHAIRGWSKFRGTEPAELFAWLRTIARRTTFRRARKQEATIALASLFPRRSGSSQILQVETQSLCPREQSEFQEKLRALDLCLSRLPDADQRLLNLRHRENLRFDQIAALVDKSTAACRMAYLRALAKLRQMLEADGDS